MPTLELPAPHPAPVKPAAASGAVLAAGLIMLPRIRPRIRLMLFSLGFILIAISCASAAEPAANQSAQATVANAAPAEEEIEPGEEEPVIQVTPTGIVIPVTAPSQEHRLVSLEFPKIIRMGDSDTVRLTLEVDETGQITPTAEVAGNQLEVEPIEIPNVYDLYNMMVEARLDIAGMEISPQGEVTEPLRPGQEVSFYWSVSPVEAGVKRGTLWLHLILIPKGGGIEERQALMARRMEINATSFLGMNAGTARVAGTAGSILSFVMGFPFLESLLATTFRRLRRGAGKAQ